MYRRLIRGLARIDYRLVYAFSYGSSCLAWALMRWNPLRKSPPTGPVRVLGLDFPNPVGLAAGFDRYGTALPWLRASGFGFVEVGTINRRPARAAALDFARPRRRLRKIRRHRRGADGHALPQVIGVSLGSARNTLDERSTDDFVVAMDALWDVADYFMVNLSRPASPTRSESPDGAAIRALLTGIAKAHCDLRRDRGSTVPLLVKVALDEREQGTAPLAVRLAKELSFDGVLAAFEDWSSRDRVLAEVEELSRRLRPLPLMVVGGIRCAEDARQTLAAGAALVQVYSALIERGPLTARAIVGGLAERGVSSGVA
jgi:dihydroorotate dehydrogenase